MKYTRLVVAVSLVSGCATQLSDQAKLVRPVALAPANCKHLGMVSTFQPVIAGGLRAAEVDIRNKVALAGGNVLVMSNRSVDTQGHADIIGDAYSCP